MPRFAHDRHGSKRLIIHSFAPTMTLCRQLKRFRLSTISSTVGNPAMLERPEVIERIGRGEWIRTTGLLVPNQALYQAEPRPEQSPV